MQMAVISLFPSEKVRYKFINRGETPFPNDFGKNLKSILKKYFDNGESLSQDSIDYLHSIRFLTPFYIDYLSKYKYDSNEVHIEQNGGDLSITIEGYWYRTILWEVPLLALISELYFEMTAPYRFETKLRKELSAKNKAKGEEFKKLNIKFADFGTRRRYSDLNHRFVLEDLMVSAGDNLVGTSNVLYAKQYGLKAIGTHAHEWFMFHAAKYGFHEANKLALESWVKVYKGDLGIALSDTFTTDSFFKSFDIYYAKLFDGVRHDSGDPITFGERVIEHYRLLGLDENVIKSKTIVFSDALNLEKITLIEKTFKGRINTSYGIGTWLTNDIPEIKPLNIVIKLDSVLINNEWVQCIKLSDELGKYTGDKETIELAKKVLKIK
jgi:nicotinate phosphoribosyltransferase